MSSVVKSKRFEISVFLANATASIASTAAALLLLAFLAASCTAVIPAFFAAVTLASVSVSALLISLLAVFAAVVTAAVRLAFSSEVKPALLVILPF